MIRRVALVILIAALAAFAAAWYAWHDGARTGFDVGRMSIVGEIAEFCPRGCAVRLAREGVLRLERPDEDAPAPPTLRLERL
jgi:hypothetical protein